jgi:hypothetical protein
MKGAQIGGTECGNCWIGYVIHQAPGPMMAVAPTVELAKRNSKQRIDPLIEESEVLRARVKERRSRDSGNRARMFGCSAQAARCSVCRGRGLRRIGRRRASGKGDRLLKHIEGHDRVPTRIRQCHSRNDRSSTVVRFLHVGWAASWGQQG